MIQMICAFDPDLRILIVSKHELEQNAVCNYFIYKSLCNVELRLLKSYFLFSWNDKVARR